MEPCDDACRPEKAHNHADSRRSYARAFLAGIAVAATLGLIWQMCERAEYVRTKRVYARNFFTDSTHIFNVSGGTILDFRRDDSIYHVRCPCDNRTLSWSRFSTFYTQSSLPPQQQQQQLSDSKPFCDDLVYRNFQPANSTAAHLEQFAIICAQIFSYVINKEADINPAADCARYTQFDSTGQLKIGAARRDGAVDAARSYCYGVYQHIESDSLMDSCALNLTAVNQMLGKCS